MASLDPRLTGFFALTGVSIGAFASGFGVCLFDIETVDQCVALSNMWLEKFIVAGNHLIEWFFALVFAALKFNQA